ncbi:unnamed protein product [Haemonchus placei]|uniref:Uncharacterized protein n=1 Tax=Haemonchus placei TaxID=6290 RepID=A0A0N4VVC9_HAEPC|nr:unnamed protein product [Haemonchus placei]
MFVASVNVGLLEGSEQITSFRKISKIELHFFAICNSKTYNNLKGKP